MNKALGLTVKNSRININSFVIASSIVVNVIYAIFTTSYGIGGVSSAYLSAVYALGLFNIIFSNRRKIKGKYGKSFLFLEGLLFTACVLTLLFASDTTTITIQNYFFYCFMPVLFLMFEYNTEKILRYGMYISFVSILGINTLLVDQSISTRFAQTDLGTIYDLLPCIVLAMVHFAYYRKNASKLTKLLYLYYLYMLVRMIPVIVRGAMLTLMIGVVIIYLNRPGKKTKAITKWSTGKKALVVLGIIAAVLAVLNFNYLIEWTYNLLAGWGINFGFITKFHYYIQSGNITDNREPYYELVKNTFFESPIYGKGVQTFGSYSADGAAYPHNYILQFLFEGGLLLMLPLAFVSLREIYRVMTAKYRNVDDLALRLCLLLVSVIPGFFSMNIWYNRSFWMLIMLGLIRFKRRKDK
ncbi:MAG: hypothetical protein LUG66_09565 [Clostridiales bacterium]|nr:hypothetical protein [Clostridiales bacterium]